jgi:CheY-like chemotaxis protein
MPVQDPAPNISLQADKVTQHDLRTPLNQIIGYSELLAEEAGSTNQARLLPDLQKINQAARKMVQLIDNLFLPGNCDTSDEATAAERSKPLGPAQTRVNVKETLTGRIVAVDDYELNRDMLARRLRSEGHTFSLAEDGLRAVKLLHNTPFDLILLDVMMPGMDGYEVLAKLKKDTSLRNIPVIMISLSQRWIASLNVLSWAPKTIFQSPLIPHYYVRE